MSEEDNLKIDYELAIFASNQGTVRIRCGKRSRPCVWPWVTENVGEYSNSGALAKNFDSVNDALLYIRETYGSLGLKMLRQPAEEFKHVIVTKEDLN